MTLAPLFQVPQDLARPVADRPLGPLEQQKLRCGKAL